MTTPCAGGWRFVVGVPPWRPASPDRRGTSTTFPRRSRVWPTGLVCSPSATPAPTRHRWNRSTGLWKPDAAGWEAGDLRPRAKAAIPSNWLNCNGQSVGTATWPNLFAAIGYAFGGSGSSFLLPDLRGRKNVGVSSLVALASNEGQAENARLDEHGHPVTVDGAVPGPDDAPGNIPEDASQEPQGHHHQLAVGGSNTTGRRHWECKPWCGNQHAERPHSARSLAPTPGSDGQQE